MTLREFLNAAAILNSIDDGQVPELNSARWHIFEDGPIDFLSRADDGTAAAIWREVERRMQATPAVPDA